MAKQDQYLDCLIISRNNSTNASNAVPSMGNVLLPDGLELNKSYNLLSYKSCRESLTMWSIQELIGYYTGYRKDLRSENDNQLPDEQLFQLYAVTTHYPKTVAEQAHTWKTTDKSGVYWLFVAGLWIQVIVTAQIALAPHNALWNLLSDNVEAVRFGLQFVDADLPELQQIKEYYQL